MPTLVNNKSTGHSSWLKGATLKKKTDHSRPEPRIREKMMYMAPIIYATEIDFPTVFDLFYSVLF